MKNIDIRQVSKKFGFTVALDDVSLSFEENRIYGLLGRNGAGKSTLLNIITGRIFADGGFVTVDGENVTTNDLALGKVYMLSEKTYYPEKMKVRDAFKWTKDFYPNFDTEYANNLASRFKLNPAKTVKSLSTGYNSIFKLIIALSTNAPYLLLDEPVLGLDANHRDLFYKVLLEKYSENPCCIVISTHLVEEVSAIIDDVIIINEGHITYNEPTSELLSKGYTVSGAADRVDAYTAGRKVLGSDKLGALKAAYIFGTPDSEMPDGLELSRLDLQKLFVQLTNSDE